MQDADIPAVFFKGAFERLGGHLDFSRDPLTLQKQGVAIPLRVTRVARYILSVAGFGKDASRQVRGPVVLAACF